MFKKLSLVALVCGLSASAFGESSDSAPFTGRVIGNKVRIRTAPTLESHVLRDSSQGELFAVTGEENGFYKVQPPSGTKGYVFRTFVLDGVVEGERVNIRLYPDMEAPIVARLNTGDRVEATVSDVNNKWLEIDLPQTAHFYIACEYVNNIGTADMLAELEGKKTEASHQLSSTFAFARAELQKPFEEIDLESIEKKFSGLDAYLAQFPEMGEKAREANQVIRETFVQKKIAFLEQKADRTYAANDINPEQLNRLAEVGRSLKVGEAASGAIGLSSVSHEGLKNDKMQMWAALEESVFQLSAAAREGRSMKEFYHEEELDATVLTGIVEPYNRPVKNKPGDYLLRLENRPVAFLYSTHVDLQEMVGKEVTVMGSPRSSNHFAFPTYYVLSVE